MAGGLGDDEVGVVVRPVAALDEIHQAAVGEVQRAVGECIEPAPRGGIAELAGGGAIEREVPVIVFERLAGCRATRPSAERSIVEEAGLRQLGAIGRVPSAVIARTFGAAGFARNPVAGRKGAS